MRYALRFWLERGVDGFRIDMIDFLEQGRRTAATSHRRQTQAEDYLSAAAKYQMNRPETHDYIQEMRRTVHSFDPERVHDRRSACTS